MDRKIAIISSLAALLLGACTAEPLQDPQESPAPEVQSEDYVVSKVTGVTYARQAVVPGILKVKFNESFTGRIEECGASVGILCADTKATPTPFRKFRPLSMHRLFEYAGEYEPRTRAAGLNRWYVLEFDAAVDLAEAELSFHGAEEVEAVEYQLVAKVNAEPFNDPQLPSQWHYHNPGTAAGTVAGCDINVYPVWQAYAPGAADVVVGVVDEGIDTSHPDLAANIWTEPGTGIHGRNFVTGGAITPDEHGTHVAGTIAAVNNNGIGVSGVAGGDAARGISGAKLMSCQIFYGDKSADGAPAIKWSADHGAIISQNSWGYPADQNGDGMISDSEIAWMKNYTISGSLKDAIDYFIKYAGCDNDGNQLPDSPMKGGVVIFAAGNDNMPYGPPGSGYDPIINVSAVGADYKRAYYSNYGPWCDIAAPGGDAYKGYQILSTLPGGRYGTMQGTSMACPHVSGVAALIVANMGGSGFTCQDLEEILLGSARPEEIKRLNTEELGVGMVSAADAVISGRSVEHTLTPEGGSSLSMKLSQTREIGFEVFNPTGHAIEISLEPEMPGVTAEVAQGSNNRRVVVRIDGRQAAGGEWDKPHSLSGTVSVSCPKEPGDVHSATFSATIEANTAPVMLRQIDGIVVDRLNEDSRISLGNYFFDSDGDPLNYEISETPLGKFSLNAAGQVTFSAVSYGSGEVSITASDEFGGSISQTVSILVRDGQSRAFDLYPNPVTDYLYVRGSEEYDVSVEIYSESGARVFSEEVKSSPFEPARLDLASLDGGLYTVRLTSGDLQQTSRISKL